MMWLSFGWLTLVLGAIGAFLPVMPTVPFLILSVWAFSRSSPRLRNRILRHPKFGPPIRAWQRGGIISRPAKIWSTLAMAMGVGWALLLGLHPLFIAAQATVCICVAAYLLTRPEV